MKISLSRTVNAQARKAKLLKDADSNLGGEHIREGLSAVIAVWVPQPEFEGQTKTRLGNPEVRKVVEGVIGEQVAEHLEFYPSVLGSIFAKASSAQKAAEAAKRARELVRRKSVLRSGSLPGSCPTAASADPGEHGDFPRGGRLRRAGAPSRAATDDSRRCSRFAARSSTSSARTKRPCTRTRRSRAW